MFLLPYEKFEIEASLSLEQSRQRLASIIGRKPSFAESFKYMFRKSGTDQFMGEVTQEGFKIRRIIYYRNSFLPQITGQFLPSPRGTKVQVTMTLHPVVLVFMAIWFAAVGFALVASAPIGLKDPLQPIFLIQASMFLFGFIMVQSGFLFEARKARKIISRLFANAV